MIEDTLLVFILIISLGIAAQWLAWLTHLPAILVLLLLGFLVGPLTNLIDPESHFKGMLLPIVSTSVALILFEGGLSLKLSELQERMAVRRLVIAGLLMTWLLCSLAAYLILNMSVPLSLLLGAILVVTGPTTIMPMLRQLRLSGAAERVLKWEAILNDSLGAVLAVLVFEAFFLSGTAGTVTTAIGGLVKAMLFSILSGVAGAMLIIFAFKRYWVPDYLKNPFVLAVVLLAFAIANQFQKEAGLISVVLMGIILANQTSVHIKSVARFKENLRVLLISFLFILLASRIRMAELKALDWNSLLFVAAVILVIRPVAVMVSTIHTRLTVRERLFLSLMAPRGIVAAAMASTFALELLHDTHTPLLVPVTFLVIIFTIVFSGMVAQPAASVLGLLQKQRSGCLILGVSEPVIRIAERLAREGIEVTLIDKNKRKVDHARQSGLNALQVDVLSEKSLGAVKGIGPELFLAMSSNDNVNIVSSNQVAGLLGSINTFQLQPSQQEENEPRDRALAERKPGRYLFSDSITFDQLVSHFREGATLHSLRISQKEGGGEDTGFDADRAIPLFLIEDHSVTPFTTDMALKPRTGQTVIYLTTELRDHNAP